MSISPFDYVKTINDSKIHMMDSVETEKDYNAFIVNRSMSYFHDTVLLANEMNRYHHTDSRLQYDFLFHSVRKRKRFSKWLKKDNGSSIDVIMRFYKYNYEKARSVVGLFSDDQLNELKERMNINGKRE